MEIIAIALTLLITLVIVAGILSAARSTEKSTILPPPKFKIEYRTEPINIQKTYIGLILEDGSELTVEVKGRLWQHVSSRGFWDVDAHAIASPVVYPPQIESSMEAARSRLSTIFNESQHGLSDYHNPDQKFYSKIKMATIGRTIDYYEDCQVAYLVENT